MPISFGFKGTGTIGHAYLPERLKNAGFALLSDRELGAIVANADSKIKRLARWIHKLDYTHWGFFFATQIPVLLMIWVSHGLTLLFVVAQTFISAAISILFQLVVRKLSLERARKSFRAIFDRAYSPTVDQAHRVRSISRWIAAVGRVELEDGRTVVAISVPALNTILFAVDEYRKKY